MLQYDAVTKLSQKKPDMKIEKKAEASTPPKFLLFAQILKAYLKHSLLFCTEFYEAVPR